MLQIVRVYCNITAKLVIRRDITVHDLSNLERKFRKGKFGQPYLGHRTA